MTAPKPKPKATPSAKVKRKPESAKTVTKTVKPKRKPIPAGLRYDLLVAAGFRCQACGVPASQARLEIDHKHPLAKGGKDIKQNYQVLCTRCNRGKGAKLKKGKVSVRKHRRIKDAN